MAYALRKKEAPLSVDPFINLDYIFMYNYGLTKAQSARQAPGQLQQFRARVEAHYPRPSALKENARTMLETRGLAGPGLVDISLTLHAGEILGVGGLAGHGHRELFFSLFGAAPATEGEIAVVGKRARMKSSRDAVRLGIALVPEDGKTEGLLLPGPQPFMRGQSIPPRLPGNPGPFDARRSSPRSASIHRAPWFGLHPRRGAERVTASPQEIKSRVLLARGRDRLLERATGFASALLLQPQTSDQPLQLGKRKDVAVSLGRFDPVRQGFLRGVEIADDQGGLGEK